jgi:hypothetical protein
MFKMRWMKVTCSAAAIAALAVGALSASPSWAEGEKIDCKDTNLTFDAPGFTVSCKDYSDNSISTGELNAATKTFTLFATSEQDLTFLHVFSNRVVGGTRLSFTRRGLESQVEETFPAKFTGWGSEEDHGDYEVKHVTAAFKGDDPMECLAFRKESGRRLEGITGMIVGFTCSGEGRDRALNAMKLFLREGD